MLKIGLGVLLVAAVVYVIATRLPLFEEERDLEE